MPSPRILVTNDDGIDSAGLHALARAMTDHGEVVVVAPDQEYSGASAAIGALWAIKPEARRSRIDGVPEAWAVTGPPGLCVTFACMGAFGDPPDLVVSGINPGENVGRAVYHSGTVGAGITARIRHVASVAVSQKAAGAEVEGQATGTGEQRWDTAAAVASIAVAAVLDAPGGPSTVVNLNVPNLPLDELRGWRSTTLATTPARALASAALQADPDDPGRFDVKMHWGEPTTLPPETDGGAVGAGEVSVTLLGRLQELPLTDLLPELSTALDRHWPHATGS